MPLLDALWSRTDQIFSMANALSLDLYAPGPETPLSPQDLRSKVMNCLLCRHAAQCASVLAGEATLVAAPTYCRNRDFLDRLLAAGQTTPDDREGDQSFRH